MNKLLETILNGRDLQTALNEECDSLLDILEEPSVPMTYDTVVEEGIRMSLLTPIPVVEAERMRKERARQGLFSMASFL